MKKYYLLPFIFLFYSLFSYSPSYSTIPPDTSSTKLLQLDVRHLEPKGIGFDKGYTTLEGFWSYQNNRQHFLFSDIRLHRFNNGKFASNLGVGFRKNNSRCWGSNLYYDYRRGKRGNYNQLALGFESLGSFFDARLNGYFPLGKRKYFVSNAEFHSLEGHQIRISRKQQYAMSGGDLNFGFHFWNSNIGSAQINFGPYYFRGNHRQSIGGELNVQANFLDHLTLRAGGSYDSLFHGVGYAEIGLTFLFGRSKDTKGRSFKSCSLPPIRKEIVVLDKKRKTSAAINPSTGKPYVVWFVDNTSNSLGTYESPFPTLLQAEAASSQGDIIYIFPGNGTDQGMDLGFIMKGEQKLFGAAINQPVPTQQGNIVIPAQSTSFPLLSSSGSDEATYYVIVLNDNCEVAGLRIQDMSTSGSACIISLDRNNNPIPVQNTFIHDNYLTTNGNLCYGIYLVGGYTGLSEVTRNTIISNSGSGTTSAIILGAAIGPNASYKIQENNVSGFDLFSISITSAAATFPMRGIVSDNTVVVADGSIGIRVRTIPDGAAPDGVSQPNVTRLINNTVIGDSASIGFSIRVDSEIYQSCFHFIDNQVITSDSSITGYFFQNTTINPETFRVIFEPNNTGDVLINPNPITQVSSGSCQ